MLIVPRTQESKIPFNGDTGAPSVPALHDALRDGATIPIAATKNHLHPLKARLENWDDTQFALRMQSLNRTFGPGEPIRRTMELDLVRSTGFVPLCVGGPSNVHLDILHNKEDTLEWEDIYKHKSALDFHTELERSMKI